MRFKVLGSLEVWHDGEAVALSAPKHRALLATLLLHPNQVVSVASLVDHLWGDAAPATADQLVKLYVSQLRRALARSTAPGELATRPPGYLLRVQDGQLDVDVFQELTNQASLALSQGHSDLAATTATRALDLWRGEPLADVPSVRLRESQLPPLIERRMEATELRIEAGLQQGHHRQLISELQQLTVLHPLRERLCGFLMLALHRAGRKAEALACYRDMRVTLSEELGLDPDQELKSLEQRILSDDVSLRWDEHKTASSAEVLSRAAPFTLPMDIGDFVGRESLSEKVRGLLARQECTDATAAWPRGGASTVVAIAGKGGVGKTTLAVHVAHELRSRFPDGMLYADLRGHGLHPASPQEVLSGLLNALGVDGRGLPYAYDDRVSFYRSLVADQRLLVLLDNAAGEAQVRSLLPTGTGCAAIITSRRPLAGLESAHLLDLDVLEPAEALDLLSALTGADRVDGEMEAALEICRCCGLLPLAVRIAGAKLATRSHWRLADYARRIDDDRQALDALVAGDLEVRATLAGSYRELAAEERQTFRLLGLVQAADFPAWVLVPLLDQDLRDSFLPGDLDERLERLVDAQVLEVSGRDGAGQTRYRFHDLLRVFARERLLEEETAAERSAAMERYLLSLVAFACEATGALNTARRMPRMCAEVWTASARWPAPQALRDDPRAWLEAERSHLVDAVDLAYERGSSAASSQLALALAAFLEPAAHRDDWQRSAVTGLSAARRAGEHLQEAWALLSVGNVHRVRCRFLEACRCYLEALTIFKDLHHPVGAAYAVQELGICHLDLNEFNEAASRLQEALSLFQACADLHGQATTLHWLGGVRQMQGRNPEAIDLFGRALEGFKELKDPSWVASTLNYLAIGYRDAGRPAEALACSEEGLALFSALGERSNMVESQRIAGCALQELGRLDEAIARLRQAVASSKALSDRHCEAKNLYCLAGAFLKRGEFEASEATYKRALTILCNIDAVGEAAVHLGLGRLERAKGSLSAARMCFERARPAFQGFQYRRGQALLTFELGLLERDLKNWAVASRLLREAADLFLALGHACEREQVLRTLQDLPR